MAQTQTAPYGSWKSPITSDLITSGTIRIGEIMLDGVDVYWTESRPAEAGRTVIVRMTPDGTTTDVTPPPFNARDRVHEYGGGAYLPHDGVVYFSNFSDNRLYRVRPGEQPAAITAEGPLRYADFVMDATRNRLIAVREDHTTSDQDAENTIVAINLSDGSQEVLVSGNDFYSNPRLSPDGSQVCWLTWNHPNMPWDGTELFLGSIGADGTISGARQVAGGQRESIFQPEWSPDGRLYLVSDRTGWWNIYRLNGDALEPLIRMEAEFGTPQWVFRMSTYAFQSADSIVCIVGTADRDELSRINTNAKSLHRLDVPYTDISDIAAAGSKAYFLGASPAEAEAVVCFDTESGATKVLKRSSDVEIDGGYLSMPESIEFPTENGLTAHAYYYPPHNKDYVAPEGELPPLIVAVHGGPTGKSGTAFDPDDIQFWTSRGFAVVDVNYGGSSGYGRAYRERLNENWGVVDVDDAVNAARYLAERGLADPNRLIIHGGSAGGYTTLSVLAFRDTFNAGTSYFGIGDLQLFSDTHKFESRYLDGLIGPYPERADRYRDRSAIHHMHQFNVPVALFQGLDDKVVPPNQADTMAEALREKGIPFAHVAYEGEGHGFRKAENIKRTLDGELYFYSRIFEFDLAEPVEPLQIENLPEPAEAR